MKPSVVFWWFVFMVIAITAIMLFGYFFGYSAGMFGLFLFVLTGSVTAQLTIETLENPIERFERHLPCNCLVCQCMRKASLKGVGDA